MHTRMYLRASTIEQDADRARAQLDTFAADHGLVVVGTYVENESGAKLARPELFRLLSDSRPGDVLLVEQVDRLSRLTEGDWKKLRAEVDARQVRIVALDLPTSWSLAKVDDEFTSRILTSLNGLLLDFLAAFGRKDYVDRERRAAQGREKAKAQGKYQGRPENAQRNADIASLLADGKSWTDIERMIKCSRSTIAKVAKRAA